MAFFTMNLRSRRETATRDAANSRQFEHWQTGIPSGSQYRPQLGEPSVILDMNPINSRSSDSKLYFQSQGLKAGQDSFTENPYFGDYSPAFDSRNAIRELRSAVFEDRFDRGVKESGKLLGRCFTNAWASDSENQEQIHAYESLRPQKDDIAKDYRKTLKSNQNESQS